MDRIHMHELRKSVDERYVGFRPNGSSVKPVHIASGATRIIFGHSANTDEIKKLSFVADAKGNSGRTTEEVYNHLVGAGRIDKDDISKDSLGAVRSVLQKVLAGDGAVYGINDGMISYTAGSRAFITRPALYEDAGEFIGGVIKSYCPELAVHVRDLLDNTDDPISVLFEPVIDEATDRLYNVMRHPDLPAFANPGQHIKDFLNGLSVSGHCLLAHFETHPNKLTKLRYFNFFCIFSLIRYMALLEAFYCGAAPRPILVDFTGDNHSSIARASIMCYTQIHRALSRFYAWGFAQELKKQKVTKHELIQAPTPIYDQKKTATDETDHMWEIAQEQASNLIDEEEVWLIFGTAIYDMIALEASAQPVTYLRNLGTQTGMLWPPTNLHPSKTFRLSQDVLEMVIRSCVMPTETISSAQLRTRLWERFGIVIGGNEIDEKLYEIGSIPDADSLSENFNFFAKALESMNFAEVMADGILQIRLGGTTI